MLKEETIENRFGFTGEQYDPVAGMYYLRARFYNPVIGRFIQEDTYYGDGLNLYTYCHNNPVRYVDPSGHEGEMCKNKQASIKYLMENEKLSEADALKRYEYMRAQNQNLTPAQMRELITGESGSDTVKSNSNNIVVTEEVIRNAMKDAPLKTQQKAVSIPVIQEYVNRVLAGEVDMPDIKVDGDIIVDGNHRYITSRITGTDVGIKAWSGGKPDNVVDWADVILDSFDWGNR